MNTRPRSVSITFMLIILNTFIWLAFGIIVIAHIHPALPNSPLVKGLLASLAFITAGILLTFLLLLIKHLRIAYFFMVATLTVLSLATIFDDFGWIDFVVLVIGLVPLILLIKDRAWYLRAKPEHPEYQKAA